MILDGKSLALNIEEQLSVRVEKIKKHLDYIPILASIIVGDDAASLTYVKMKKRAVERIGLESKIYNLPSSTSTDELISLINKLNQTKEITGILLQHPVPKHIDENLAFSKIAINKDVDGVNPTSFGNVALNIPAFKCATPLGVICLLNHYNIKLEGKHIVIIGRSSILGKPLALLFLNENATVTICHSKTKALEKIIMQADIVVGALGKPKFIKAEWIKQDAILIDCGYNEGNVGDIDLENAAFKASYYTPVPGGVGPMTIAMLLTQTVEAIEHTLN